MATRTRCGWWALAIGLVLCVTTAPAWADDMNGDGVDDLLNRHGNSIIDLDPDDMQATINLNYSGEALYATNDAGRTPCAGDLNCDGVVDFFDIDPFVCALQGPPCYLPLYPNCRYLNGDCDHDGYVTFFDIDPFVIRLGTACPPPGIVIETVPVGNPGNVGELSGTGAGLYGPDRICGAVGYTYKIGKYEVTAGQYAAFLNSVAATDAYGLYNTSMWSDGYGCKIQRSGAPGSYTYSVAPDWANRPVNYVSWGDAARFANWLHNGQPTGAQDLSTTEDGAYYLNGATSDAALLAVIREADWTWAITSEDEWYKAAYHKNDGVTGNYRDFPMGSNAVPNNGNPGGDTGNSANFRRSDGVLTIGSPYWRTEAGYFGQSDSPYGTFDQGGNVWEWNEAMLILHRGFRGGSFLSYDIDLHAAVRDGFIHPTYESLSLGFRVSEVP